MLNYRDSEEPEHFDNEILMLSLEEVARTA